MSSFQNSKKWNANWQSLMKRCGTLCWNMQPSTPTVLFHSFSQTERSSKSLVNKGLQLNATPYVEMQPPEQKMQPPYDIFIIAKVATQKKASLMTCFFQWNPPLRAGEILLRNVKLPFGQWNDGGRGWVSFHRARRNSSFTCAHHKLCLKSWLFWQNSQSSFCASKPLFQGGYNF